jgi:hypothetical protein
MDRCSRPYDCVSDILQVYFSLYLLNTSTYSTTFFSPTDYDSFSTYLQSTYIFGCRHWNIILVLRNEQITPTYKYGFGFCLRWPWRFLVFWDVMPCSLVDRYQHLIGSCRLHLQGRTVTSPLVKVRDMDWFQILSKYLPGGTEEMQEIPQSGEPAFRQKF